jgi:hypothetical protein
MDDGLGNGGLVLAALVQCRDGNIIGRWIDSIHNPFLSRQNPAIKGFYSMAEEMYSMGEKNGAGDAHTRCIPEKLE